MLQKCACKAMQCIQVLGYDPCGNGVSIHDQFLDFIVDLDGRTFTVIAVLRDLAAQEDLLLFLTKCQGSHFLTHTPLTDHFPCHLSASLDIVPGAGGEGVKNQFLCYPASQEDRKAITEVPFGVSVFFVDGKLLGQAQGPSTGDNRHLVDGIRTGDHFGNKCVPCLVVSGSLFLCVTDDHAAPLGPHEDLVLGLFEIFHDDMRPVPPGSKKGGFVDQVGKVGA